MNRAHAAAHFHLELAEAKTQLGILKTAITTATRVVPTHLVGRILQPDRTAGRQLQVEFQVPGAFASMGLRVATTSDDGRFELQVPPGASFPSSHQLAFTVRGANGPLAINVAAADVGLNGLITDLVLSKTLDPLPISIVASLKALTSAGDASQAPTATAVPAEVPELTLGEDGHCSVTYRTNVSVDRFPYSIFLRLVEPRTSIVSPTIHFRLGDGLAYIPITDYFPLSEGDDVTVDYVDRVPVDQPISVDGFRDQLVGVGSGTVVSGYETVAMAGTLGLGYVVRMAQQWTPKGLTLGNLVYSLPLAPGEQQKVAIFERREVTSVLESESLTVEEQQQFAQQTDASTEAVFASAFNEAASGGSSFMSQSDSSSWGAGFIFVSGGGGSSSSSGTSSSWMNGHRDTVSRAVEDVRTSLNRQASARRRALRTGMRVASNFESAEVTTKTITNHNKLHALTVQYWEVHRLFELTTTPEGVSLVCLVPLQVIRFLPAGQRLNLVDTTAVDTRTEILTRYAAILKHADVLERRLPATHRQGLTLLKQFAADPTAVFQPAGGAAQDVIHFSLTGTFLPFEEIYVSAVTRRGTRIGPARLTGSIPPVPEVWGDPANSFPTEDSLMAELRSRRNAASGHTLQGDLALAPSVARNDVVGFEITRRFQQFNYDLVNPTLQVLSFLSITPTSPPDHLVSGTVRLTPQKLEQELGGPSVWDFDAFVHPLGSSVPESYAQNYLGTMSPGQQLPPGALPIPALQLSPVLRYSQLLDIERMTQHVVRNTVYYSKAVWMSLSSEERAIMLEGFTIGVPAGGITDATEDVPLLNCVENRVLGFYGNSMIMPFVIPRSVADDMGITNAEVQDLLTEFHKTGFSPPTSLVALPTFGVLGEAVLGHCVSGEKIDLTRFWNWQDSPADVAPGIADLTLPTTKTVTTAVTAPSALTGLTPLINNINANPTVPGADAVLLGTLAQAAAAQKGFDISALTNASDLAKIVLGGQTAAEKARADALQTTKQLQAQAVATAGNILGGLFAGNSQAGSQAASAVYGTGSGGGGGTGTGTKSGTGSDTGSGTGTGSGSGSGSGTGTGSGSGSGSGSGTGTGTGGGG
jgi:hypothetical protein